MSEGKKNDGVPDHKLAGKTGFAVVIAAITYILGGPIVGILVEISNSDELAVYDKRIDDLEKTVHQLEHQALMCSPRYAIKDEGPFEEIWP